MTKLHPFEFLFSRLNLSRSDFYQNRKIKGKKKNKGAPNYSWFLVNNKCDYNGDINMIHYISIDKF